MHGNNFHQVFIAFQPQLVFFIPLILPIIFIFFAFLVFLATFQPHFQPLRQCDWAGTFSSGQRQDFGQLPEIGETAFVAGLQKVLLEAALAGKAGERGVDAVLLPGFGGGFG